MNIEKKKRTGQTGYESNNLKRTHLFKIWLSQEEYQNLEREALNAGASSLAMHARQVLFSGSKARAEIAKVEQKKHLQLLASLNRIGNNVNQIARALNQHQQMTPEAGSTLNKISEQLNLLLDHATGQSSA
jgi:gamma-glutamylcysteine synthetase